MLLSTASAASPHAHTQSIRDLRYGEALYDYYQDRYFKAITDIMVAQSRSPIMKQGNDPQLLLGSLYLSYGMRDAATNIFKPLLDESADPYTQDLVWFYVGRMRYMDGQYAKAAEAFRSIQGSLPDAKNAERMHLMVNAYLHTGHYGEAVKVLENITSDGIWDYYSRYNLGIALIRSGRTRDGIRLLDQFNRLSPNTEEEFALRDKANIAIGYASLRENTQLDPVTFFSLVRLNGPFSNQALLGLGWAYSDAKLFQQALKPWTELSTKPAPDPTAQEALISIAYSLEQLKQPRLALSYYDKAISSYDKARADLDTALTDVDYVKLLKRTIPSSYAANNRWLDSGIQSLNLPAAEYLSELFISREFHKAYRNYRDLAYLRLQVERWREKIPMLRIMLDERRQQYTINIAKINGARYPERFSNLEKERSVLTAEVKKIEGNEAVDTLATREEWQSLKQLREIQAKLDNLSAHGLDVNAQIKEQKILYGLLQWKLHTEYPIRLWQVKKSMRELDAAMVQGTRARLSLEKLLQITPLNFDGMAHRITGLDMYLKKLSEKLGNAVTKQEQYCSLLITDALNQQRRRVDIRRTRALYAQARLYDQLSHEHDAP